MTSSFTLDLSHVDRGVYETLAVTVTAHPSETPTFLVARVLAYALEWSDGLAFSRGLSAGEEPALWRHDPTGALLAWIEVGAPDAARLHKASKASPRVAVYCHKEPTGWLRGLVGAKVHRSERIELIALDRAVLAALEARLARRNTWRITVADEVLYVEVDGTSFSGPMVRLPWPI